MPTISPMRVLIVDDNDDAAITMAFLLKRFGHEAAVAQGGEAALQQAPLFHPDALFVDLSMPGIDGFAIARQLRQTAEFVDTPLVAVTGHVDGEHQAQALAAGFTEVLSKPYTLEALQATMLRIAARVRASLPKIEAAQKAETETLRRIEESECRLVEFLRNRRPQRSQLPVSVQRSGISNVLILSEQSAAAELRLWLKVQRCRVGPVYEPSAGHFGFFVYSKRFVIRELIERHGGFRVE